MQHLEDAAQMALMRWAGFMSNRYPELDLLFHVPNGGKRNAREAARFKALGVKAGVPDLFLPVVRGDFHGMFVELKAKGGRLSDNQKSWLTKLGKQGYYAVVCYGFEDAADEIIKYLTR